MKGKSVLVDFYNLHLEYKTSDKNKQEEFIDFFKSYVPHVLKKLTEEEKQKIREIYSDFEKYGQNKKIYDDLYYNDLMIDGLTTLEGFEVVYHKSWFNSFYLVFSGENLRIQRIIDRYLDERRVAFADLRWLESNSRMYWLMDFIMTAWYWGDYHVHLVNDDNDQEMVMEFFQEMVLKFGITSLSQLFLSIYNDTIRVLEGELDIQRCKRTECNNIFLKSGNRKYCYTCKTPAKREVDKQTKRRKAELNHIRLSALIDQWLPEKGEMSITAYSLMWKLKGISELKRNPRYLQSPRSLGRYLNLKEVQDMLEEKGIHIEVYKDRKGATYNFTRIQ